MKKPFIYLLTAGLAFSMITNTDTANANALESKASVTFTTPVPTLVDPVNPREPSEEYPGNPAEDGDVNEEASLLSLDYVSNLNFGEVQLDMSNLSDSAENLNIPVRTQSPFIQVSDQRYSGSGWNVQAELSNFNTVTSDSDPEFTSEPSLKGSSIIFNVPEVTSTGDFIWNENNNAIDPVQVFAGNDSSVEIVSTQERAENEPLNAGAHGLGTWVITWLGSLEPDVPNEKINLNIPASTAIAGEHEATISWTLTDGPGIDTAEVPVDGIDE